ncbi:hypothetical protein [Cardiobacterium hominis]|uniref:hypothetical protein n=1 Tax=Cardiobacterium hominis TaxID=2718 RepID=UPI0028D1AA52|nr:hypothetical protein [Cardiobacterium hominis]
MHHKPLALLVALFAGSVHAAATSFADSVPEKAEGVPLAYIGKATTAATALTLTFKPDGGHDIGALPQGGKLQVLLVDDKGNHLVASEYGIVGWAQARENKDAGSEAFPALETVEDKDAYAVIHYNPQLAEKRDERYYYTYESDDNPAIAGTPKPKKADEDDYTDTRHRLLETALKPDGARYSVDCSPGVEGGPYCVLVPVSKTLPASDDGIFAPEDLTLPGNGYLYSHTDDGGRYFRAREKWRVQDKETQNIEQPYYYLGVETTYHGRWHQDESGDNAPENRAEPLKLTDRIDGNKTVAEVAPGSKITLVLIQQRFVEREGEELDYEQRIPAWALVKTADGKTGWFNIGAGDGFPNIEELHGFAG